MNNSYYQRVSNATSGSEAYKIFVTARNNQAKVGGGFYHQVLFQLAKEDRNCVAVAMDVFNEMKRKGIQLKTNNYNKVIHICVKAKNMEQAWKVRSEMYGKVRPDSETFNHLLKGSIEGGAYSSALGILDQAQKNGQVDSYTQKLFNKFIVQCVNSKTIAVAKRAFALASEPAARLKPDVHSTNQLMDYYAEQGNYDKTNEIYQLSKRIGLKPTNVICYTLIKSAVKSKIHEKVSTAYQEMKSQMNYFYPGENFRKMCWRIVQAEWSQPVEESTERSCRSLISRCQDVAYRTFLTHAAQNTDAFKKIQASRMAGSTTIASCDEARQKWEETDEKIRKLAQQRSNLNINFFEGINQSLGGTGVLRSQGVEVQSGNSSDRLYAPGDFVEAEMRNYVTWLNNSLNSPIINRIELAARASLRLVSIHPFENENGRTSRMVMDYVLQRAGLPPAAVGTNVANAIFSLSENGVTPTTVTQSTLNGVRESSRLLGVKV